MFKKVNIKKLVAIVLTFLIFASLSFNAAFAKKQKVKTQTEVNGILAINKKFIINENDVKNPTKIKKIIDKKYRENIK